MSKQDLKDKLAERVKALRAITEAAEEIRDIEEAIHFKRIMNDRRAWKIYKGRF